MYIYNRGHHYSLLYSGFRRTLNKVRPHDWHDEEVEVSFSAARQTGSFSQGIIFSSGSEPNKSALQLPWQAPHPHSSHVHLLSFLQTLSGSKQKSIKTFYCVSSERGSHQVPHEVHAHIVGVKPHGDLQVVHGNEHQVLLPQFPAAHILCLSTEQEVRKPQVLHMHFAPTNVWLRLKGISTSLRYSFWCVFFHSSQWTSSRLSNWAAAPAHREASSRLASVSSVNTETHQKAACRLRRRRACRGQACRFKLNEHTEHVRFVNATQLWNFPTTNYMTNRRGRTVLLLWTVEGLWVPH